MASTHIHYRLSLAQFHRMIEAGVFTAGDRLELIDGELRDMTPIGPPHHSCTNSLTMIFAPKLAGQAVVSVGGPLVLDDGTELYPDLMILRHREDQYAKSNPTAQDTLLVIEVADTSLPFDTGDKLRRYAEAKVPRYWVVDINNRAIQDHREPGPSGELYQLRDTLTDGILRITLVGVEIPVEVQTLFPTAS